MREKFKVAGAFLIGLSVASSVTFAQLGGRGRNVQFVDGATISPTSVVASGVSDQFVCSSTTSTCEISSSATSATTTINIPAIDIGPTATPSAQDKLVCFSYGPSGSKTRAACIDKEGDGFFSTIWGNYINSGVASGSTAYNCTNVGCRLSLGNTGRYLYDTGSTLASIGGLSADTFTATTATGSALTGGGASGTLLITSNTPDSVTGVNGPATITMQASQALTSGDQVFRVLTSTGTQAFAVRTNGSLVAGESTGQGVVNFRQWNSQQSAPTEWINDAALTEKNPMRLTHVKDVTADDASLLSIYKNLTTRVMTVSKDGLVRVNASNAAKPTCNADNRGRVFYLDGAAGVADTYEICMKDASDVYAWKTIVTP